MSGSVYAQENGSTDKEVETVASDPVREALRSLREKKAKSLEELQEEAEQEIEKEISSDLGEIQAVEAEIEETEKLAEEENNSVSSGNLNATDSFGLISETLKNININNVDNTSYDSDARTANFKGNVDIQYSDVRIKADTVKYQLNEGLILAKGNATVYKGGDIFRGEEMVYNTKTGEVKSEQLKSSVGPVLFEAGSYEGGADVDVIETLDTYFTTHDSASPNFHIKAKEIDIYPDERVVFKGAKFYIGDTPVLYLPYFTQPFDDELGYFFRPGYNTYWGAFLLNRYGFLIEDHTIAKADLDIRSGRGPAIGLELESLRYRNNPNFGRIKFYYAHDIDPEFETSSVERAELDSARYRINFQHRLYFSDPEESTLYADIDINYLSDGLFYEDFFFNEFRTDPRPDNLVNIVKHNPRGTLSVTMRQQLNDFFRRDTRLPEIALDFTTQPVFSTGFFYRGNTSFGLLRDKLTEDDRQILRDEFNNSENYLRDDDGIVLLDEMGDPRLDGQPNLDDTEFTRLHTWHEFLYPIKLGGVLNIVPRVGAGFTSYSSIEGSDISNDSLDSEIYGFGVEVSTKWSKEWLDIKKFDIGLDGLRHTVQPYLNYSYIERGDIQDSEFEGIDVLRPTTQLRALDVPLLTGVDGIKSWNAVRVGVRNLWQTKRNNYTHNWLGLNTYLDYYIEDPESDRDVSNLYNDFYWRPLPWIRLDIESQIPLGNDELNFTELNSRISWMPTPSFSIGLNHLYLKDHPIFQDSSRIGLNTYLRLNENWGFSTMHSYEGEDSTLEFQSYRIHRDLTSWTASFGAVMLSGRGNQDDAFGLVLTFTLKDFPDVTIPLDFNPSPSNR